MYLEEANALTARLTKEVSESNLLTHDFLTCFQNGGYFDMSIATRVFALNHYAYSRHFLKYLQFVKDKLAAVSPQDVHLLAENVEGKRMLPSACDCLSWRLCIAEELGQYEEEDLQVLVDHGIKADLVKGIPHTVLIRRFLERVNVSQADFENTETIGAVFTRDILQMYNESNACEAIAMIGFSVEQTVPTLYQYIWDGLKHHTEMTPEDIVFFPLHILVDDGHADHLKDAFKALYARDPWMCANARDKVHQVLRRRSKMLSDLKRHVEEVSGGVKCGQGMTSAEALIGAADAFVSAV